MDEAFKEALSDASQVMVGINTRSGPHVTPELFTVSGGRIWCLTAATTLKARLLAQGGRISVAARSADCAAVAIGTAVVIDPVRPTKSTAGVEVAARAPLAVSAFVATNAAELTGAVIDALSGKLGGPLPPHRVLLSIEPTATVTLDSDGRLIADGWDHRYAAEGPAADASASADQAAEVDLVADVPPNLQRLTTSGPAFLGWTTAAGDPLVLPAAWDAGALRATLADALLRETGAAAAGRAAVTRDEWTGFGPTGKQGIMLRGQGSMCDAGGTSAVELAIDGVTYWDGVKTGSVAS